MTFAVDHFWVLKRCEQQIASIKDFQLIKLFVSIINCRSKLHTISRSFIEEIFFLTLIQLILHAFIDSGIGDTIE